VLVRLALLLRLLVLELAVVEDAADGRVGVRRDLDEVQALFAGHLERLLDGDDTEFLTLVVDDEDFPDTNPFVDAKVFGRYARFLLATTRVATAGSGVGLPL
jgi:hypothetical protein